MVESTQQAIKSFPLKFSFAVSSYGPVCSKLVYFSISKGCFFKDTNATSNMDIRRRLFHNDLCCWTIALPKQEIQGCSGAGVPNSTGSLKFYDTHPSFILTHMESGPGERVCKVSDQGK